MSFKAFAVILTSFFLISCDGDEKINFPDGAYVSPCEVDGADSLIVRAVKSRESIKVDVEIYAAVTDCSGSPIVQTDVVDIDVTFSNVDLGNGVSYFNEVGTSSGEAVNNFTPFLYEAPNLYIGDSVEDTGDEVDFENVFANFIGAPKQNVDTHLIKQ